ncbi:hypothetical protein BCR34DRAFT_630283 [Clohesyomyces aquaticus]|uniref:Uncharacterized protein n=1 Tax=Clohesyomyces aquaticus TaxID=1231657 RepID=A0A1Y2A5N1_9PLEO|nr:hypothetical protein BCR34DRAFT_630283 [Clohesyomyces aquaticus]
MAQTGTSCGQDGQSAGQCQSYSGQVPCPSTNVVCHGEPPMPKQSQRPAGRRWPRSFHVAVVASSSVSGPVARRPALALVGSAYRLEQDPSEGSVTHRVCIARTFIISFLFLFFVAASSALQTCPPSPSPCPLSRLCRRIPQTASSAAPTPPRAAPPHQQSVRERSASAVDKHSHRSQSDECVPGQGPRDERLSRSPAIEKSSHLAPSDLHTTATRAWPCICFPRSPSRSAVSHERRPTRPGLLIDRSPCSQPTSLSQSRRRQARGGEAVNVQHEWYRYQEGRHQQGKTGCAGRQREWR